MEREGAVVVAMVLAHGWAVLQLAVLGSLARTVRVRTVLLGIAVGLYVCAPAAVLVQLAWTRLYAAVTGTSLATVVATASYTLDPAIEEVVKVLPLVALLGLPTVRRQWSLTDWVLVGAAIGSGFGLAENLLRFSHLAGRTIDAQGGWVIATNLATPTVPNLGSALTSWLPDGVATGGLFGAGPADAINVHLVWSAVAGFGVGLARSSRAGRLPGVLLVTWAAADHAALNAEVVGDPGIAGLLTWPLDVVRNGLWLLPVVALGAAWWLDRRRRAPIPVTLLAAERAALVTPLGAWQASVARLPWSLLWTEGFCRLRRAHGNAAKSGDDGRLGELVEELRAQIDAVEARGPDHRPRLPGGWGQLSAVLRRPEVIAWLLLLLPPLVFFVLGGWRRTTWLQRALETRAGFAVVVVAALAALGWTAWQLVASVRRWREASRHPLADVPAAANLRIAVGGGALAVGVLLLILVLTGAGATDRVVSNFHVLDALATALIVAALLLAVAATFWFPPLAVVALAGGGSMLVVTSAAATWAAAAAGLLGYSGVMLAEASGQSSGATSSRGSGGQGRLTPDELARNPQSARGKPRAEVERALDDLLEQPGWQKLPVKKGEGTRWVQTRPNTGRSYTVERQPRVDDPLHQGWYLKVSDGRGGIVRIPLEGNPVLR